MHSARTLHKFRVSLSYKILILWRMLVYTSLLDSQYMHKISRLAHNALAFVFQGLVCLINSNHGRTRSYMDHWRNQTAVLFAPDITPVALYATSFTEACVVLDEADMGSSGKMIFFSHGAYMLQNLSSVLTAIAGQSEKPFINVLLFRRQTYPHVEQWWKSYALSLKINLEIVHDDELLLIRTAKDLLKEQDVVLCGPDYFFSTEMSFDEAMMNYRKVASLFVRMAKSSNADVLYVHSSNIADFMEESSVLRKISGYDAKEIEKIFAQELLDSPDEWFFSYNHYHSMQSWNSNGVGSESSL